MMQSSKSDEREAPYSNSCLLYTMHFCFAFTARMWDMGIILLLSDLSGNNLTLVAFGGFLSSLFVVLFMSKIGQYLDNTNRLSAAQLALGVKILAIASAYILCGYLSFVKGTDDFKEYLLWTIPIIAAIANLSFSTVSQSVEKDWIVVLANSDSRWLSITNSRMTQIDSGCNAFAPALTGLLFVQFNKSTVAGILLLTNAFSTILLYIFMHNLYYSWSGLAVRSNKKNMSKSMKVAQETTSLLPSSKSESIKEYDDSSPFYQDFMESGCAGTLISYAFLYLTVLNFGSMMTVYLRWCKLSDAWIGSARGAGAFTALLGATIFPYFAECAGIYRASNFSILFQFILVVVACSTFFLTERTNQLSLEILCIAVLLSRSGLWMFDLGVRQIAQETIPEHCRGKVNGQWKSLTSAFEMTSYIIAAFVSDPQYFWILSLISGIMVGSALIIFTVTRPDLYKAEDTDDNLHIEIP